MSKREVDRGRTSRALRRLRRAAERAGQEGAPGLSTWEKDFVEGVTARLETYGSAFRDPAKGPLKEPLSSRQGQIVRAIETKTRLKARQTLPDAGSPAAEAAPAMLQRTGLRASLRPGWGPRVRDINDDPLPADDPPQSPRRPARSRRPSGRNGAD